MRSRCVPLPMTFIKRASHMWLPSRAEQAYARGLQPRHMLSFDWSKIVQESQLEAALPSPSDPVKQPPDEAIDKYSYLHDGCFRLSVAAST